MPYTVVSGDSLSRIAAANGINDWRDIYNLNRDVIGSNPNMIKPGQVLQLPGDSDTTAKSEPSTTVEEGLKQDLFNVAGGAEVWQHEDGTIYLAYQAPGTDDDPVWVTYTVSNLESYFGPDQEPVISRQVTADWWGKQGVIWMGGADDQIVNTSQDPFSTWEQDLARRAETEGPWVYDADYQQLLMEALLEGRQLEPWELQSTEWYRTHNEVQRQWMILQNGDPEQAAMLLENQKTLLVEQFRQAGGGQDINQNVIDWLASNLLNGNISSTDVTLQVRALTDPYSGINVDPALQKLSSGATFTNEGEDEVRGLLHQWLGPAFGEWGDAEVARIAGEFRNDPNARTNFVESLKDQRMALLPEYVDRNISYQAIANTWKQWWLGQWGEQPDEKSDLWLQVLRNNDLTESARLLRTEGLKRGNETTMANFSAGALSLGGSVRRPING